MEPEVWTVPVHKYVHEVAPVQFQVTRTFVPHLWGGSMEALHCGAGMQEAVTCGVVNAPASLDADSVHLSPLLVLTGICSEFKQPTGPLFGTSPVHVRVQDFAFGQFQVSVAGCPHGAGAVKFALQLGGSLGRSAPPSSGISNISLTARSWGQSSPFVQRLSRKGSQTELQPTKNRKPPTTT